MTRSRVTESEFSRSVSPNSPLMHPQRSSEGDCARRALARVGELRSGSSRRQSFLLRRTRVCASRGGVISLERGVCLTSVETLNSTNMSLPASLEGAIVTRVDALSPQVQLLLKVASAIGGPFTAEVLQNVYPGAVSLQEIDAMLDHLVERELLRVQENTAQFEFRHAISEEVTYSLLPFVQRRLLHAVTAIALEVSTPGASNPTTDSSLAIGSARTKSPRDRIPRTCRASSSAWLRKSRCDPIHPESVRIRQGTILGTRTSVSRDGKRSGRRLQRTCRL